MTPDARTPAIFFDDGDGLLAPMRDLRPFFDVRTGAHTIRDRLTAALGLTCVGVRVPDELAELTRERLDVPVNGPPACGPDDLVLVINGRNTLPLDEIDELGAGGVLVEPETGALVAARVAANEADAVIAGDLGNRPQTELAHKVLITRPWHVRAVRDLSIEVDLALLSTELPVVDRVPPGVTVIGDKPVLAHDSAVIAPTAVLCAEQGAIALHAGAVVRPGAIVQGPCSIGPGSTVLEHALIKPNTAIGPVCKVAGDVGGTVIQGYSNKAHAGHLGDSWLGEWVNLGADTTNSNLLNTYGEITAVAEPGGKHERTGETFFGCVLADHVKTAIGTRIMTGAIVHTGTMWADTAAITGCVPRFTWATPKGHHQFRFGKFEEVMRAAMGRRGVEVSKGSLERLRVLAE